MGIDWSKYKGCDSQRAKEGFEDLCNKIEEIGGELIGDYYGNKTKTEIKIDDVIINIIPHSFKRQTYKSIINFEKQLKINGDELIRFIDKDDENGLIVEIKTFDDGIKIINMRSYDSFNSGRKCLYNMCEEIGCKVKSPYLGAFEKIEIKIDDVIINLIPHSFKRQTYKSIINFEEQLKINRDKLIRYVDKDDNGGLIAEIKTFDNGIVTVSINNYNSFNKGRKSFYGMCEEIGFEVKSPYLGDSEKMEIKRDDVVINLTPNSFKNQIYKSIINFEKQLKINGDKLIRYIGYSPAGLIAEIKTFDNGIVTVSINNYNSFNNSRKRFYNIYKEKGYKVLTPYLGTSEKILIDYGCGHNTNEVTAIKIINGQGCPICKHKGEKALGELLYKMFGKENVQSHQYYGDLKGVGGGNLEDDYLCTFGHIIVHFELNGIHHYEPIPYYTNDMTDKEREEEYKRAVKKFEIRQKHDKMKKDYCNNSDNELLLVIDYRDSIIDVEKWEREIREFMIKEGLEEYLPKQTNLEKEEIA